MSLNFQPSGVTSRGTLVQDNLLAGECDDWISEQVTIKSGTGVLTRGTVLELVTVGTAATAAKTGGNTGGGTITMDGSTPVLADAVVGVYTVRCIATATNGGQFVVVNPLGQSLGVAVVGTAFANQIKFTLADVGTDFAVGDGFDVTVTAAATLKYQDVRTDRFATRILAEDIDATSGDVVTVAYKMGSFNKRALTLGSGATLAGVIRSLERNRMLIVDSIAA